jgi:GTP cyclohydrolase I
VIQASRIAEIMINRKYSSDQIQKLVKQVIIGVGENPKRDGLKETPRRVAKAYEELLSGYIQDPETTIKLFDSNGFHELVTIGNIEFYSLCEHHMLPFFGKVHIGYVPNEKILGLSKFARIVEIYSKRLQTQENLTKQIFDLISKKVSPKGLIVLIEAKHLCVSMRGIKNSSFVTKTVLKKGLLKTRQDLFRQFYKDIEKLN